MSKFLIAAATVACMVSVAAAVPAVPAVAVSTSAQHQVAADRSPVSDRDVIELFAGQGRIVAEHPEVAKYVPSGKQHLTAAQISAVLGEYRAVEPRFHEYVTVPLQSGDPYRVLDAMHAFAGVTQRIAATDAATTTGDGKCALLVAVAVAATLWVGVLVWVAARSDSSLTEEQFAAELAAALPSSRR
jgi:SdpC family antimicrobial peptide